MSSTAAPRVARVMCLALASVATPFVCTTTAAAQTFAYVTTLRKDTVAIEQYTRVGNRVEGDFAAFDDSILVHHFIIDIRPDGRVAHVDFQTRRHGAERVDTIRATFVGDSVFLFGTQIRQRIRRIHAPGAFPMYVGANAFEEPGARHVMALKRDSMIVPAVLLSGDFYLARFRVYVYAPDSVGIWNGRKPALMLFDSEGHLRRTSGVLTGVPTETVRVAPFDFAAILGKFWDRPRR